MSEDMGVGTTTYERESEDICKDRYGLLKSDFAKWIMKSYESKKQDTQKKLMCMLKLIEKVTGINEFGQLQYKDTLDLRNWLVNQSGWINTTQVRRMRWIKTIMKQYEEYCLFEQIQYPLKFTSNQIKGIKKYAENITPVLTEREILEIFKAINNRNRYMNEALYKTGYFGALRISELQNLKREHVHENINTIDIVNGKGGKSESIVIEKEAIDALLKYYNKYRIYPREEYDEFIFISNYKQKIGKSTIKARLKELAVGAGIKKRVFPHLLRASNATHRILQGWNPWEVKEYLRHSKYADTEKYIRTASLLAQGGVEIGVIKLRNPSFNHTNGKFSTKENGNSSSREISMKILKLKEQYLELFKQKEIDAGTLKALTLNLNESAVPVEKLAESKTCGPDRI